MPGADILTGAGAIAASVAVALLRLAWGRPSRSPSLTLGAWLLLLGGCALGWAGAGAWGTTVAGLAATAVALVILTHAALTTPPGRTPATDRRAHAVPAAGEPWHLGGRVLTFLLTVPLALASALAVAVAARGIATLAGWREADANVLALLLLPLGWMILMVMLMMTSTRRMQGLLIAVPAAIGGLVILAGAGA
jgi:hypothetical protein